MPPQEEIQAEEESYQQIEAGLTVFPDDIPSVATLVSLNLSNNAIEELPVAFCATAKFLKCLVLARNKLKKLPEDIQQLRRLTILDVSHNQLSSLPETLCNVLGLTELHASHNVLQELTGSIQNWTALQVLDLASNKLKTLPADVGWLPLQKLNLDDNSHLVIPKVVLSAGLRATLSYLQVVCEQHRLVENHLAKFSLQPGADPKAARPVAPKEPEALKQHLDGIFKAAGKSGILDLQYCATPDVLTAAAQLAAVYVLDGRSNKWESLSKQVLMLPGMVVLNASHNRLRTLADDAVPASLGVLNLSFNKLTTLPASLGKAPVLQQVYLANNRLTDLPTSFASLPMVDLFLSENLFTTIPKAVLGMTQLSKLSMACCQLTEVPAGLGKVATLRFLDLSFNKITSLPRELEGLTILNALNLSFNPMSRLPSVVPRLISLLELNLDYTGISDIPPEIGQLRRLEGLQAEGLTLRPPLNLLYASNPVLLVQIHNTALVSLDLSRVGLTEFPTQLVKLNKLVALNLSKNQLTTLPHEFGLMTHLQQINLRDNPWDPPYRQILAGQGEQGVLAYCNRQSERVDLTNCELEELPEDVLARGGAVQQMKLIGNKLTTLPATLANLTSLNTLVLDSNQLDELPEVLLSMPTLNILMASVNQIKDLPAAIGKCTQLQALVLQGNLIQSIPRQIGNLSQLKALSVAANLLSGDLPEEIGYLVNLRLLDISSNKISSLPATLGRLSQLKTLKAGNNALSSLPKAMLQMTGLQEVQFSGNAFRVSDNKVALDAANNAAAMKLLKRLVDQGEGSSGQPADVPVPVPVAQAPAPVAHTPAPAPQPPELVSKAPAPVVPPSAPEDSSGAEVVSAVGKLAVPVSSPKPADPPKIVTAESQESEAAKVKAREEVLKAAEEQKFLFLQKHLETVSKDPLRAAHKANWESVPLMNIPKIIAAISNPPAPPPPPPGADGEGGGCMRPQSLHRFKRVVEQSNMAMQLLGRVNDVLQKGKSGTPGGDERVSPPQAVPLTQQPSFQHTASFQYPQMLQHQQSMMYTQPGMMQPGMMLQPGMTLQQQQQQMMAQQAYMHAYQMGMQAASMGQVPPGMSVTMVQKKIGNKVVLIPAYQMPPQGSPTPPR